MNNKTLVAVLIIICAVVAGGFALTRSGEKKEAKKSDRTMTSQAEAPKKDELKRADAVATTTAAQSKELKAETSYKSPAGDDKVAFALTVNANGVITDTKTTVMAEHEISKKRQQAFGDGLTAAVKGKKLSDLQNVDKVGGSSLTTAAFNQSLAQLKAQL